MSKKAVIYARVSTEEQTKNYSIPTQLEGCRNYAEKNGFMVVDELVDSHTGRSLSRPSLDRLKQLVGTIDVIIVYRQDRLGRADALDTLNLIAVFDSQGTEVHCVDTGLIQIRSFIGQLDMLYRANKAADESKEISERMQRGKRARARAGKVVINTVAPYGYDYDSNKGMFVINPEQAEIVRMIYHWYVYGDENGERLGGERIAKKLTSMGVPTKHDIDGFAKSKKGYGVWGRSSVMKILRQPTYYGVWYYGRRSEGETPTQRVWKDPNEWIPVNVPAIVTPELWTAAQEQGPKNLKTSPRNTKHDYLMRGIMYCSTCGYTFRSHTEHRTRRNPDGIGRYVCLGQERAHSADGKSLSCNGGLSQEQVDTEVWNVIANVLQKPENLVHAFQQKRQELEAQVEPDKEFLQRCKDRLGQINKKRERLLKLYLDGAYEKDWLDNEMTIIAKEEEDLSKKITELQERIAVVEVSRSHEEQILEYCEKARIGLDFLTFEDKRRIMEGLEIKAYVYRNSESGEHRIALTGYIPRDPSDPNNPLKKNDTFTATLAKSCDAVLEMDETLLNHRCLMSRLPSKFV